jgi:hypothetical protein
MTKRTCRNCRHVDKWADEPPCNECSAHDLFEPAEMEATGPVKTWLDECAWAALIGIFASDETDKNKPNARFAEVAYGLADAMLAEKLRRENAAQSPESKEAAE